MAKDVDSMIIPLLREMRSDMTEQFSEIRQRLDKLESGQKTIRQAMGADPPMSKLATGDFENRIFELERKVGALSKDR